MIGDSIEQIQKCLNCKWPKCVNCVRHKDKGRKPRKGVKPVIAYKDGEERRFVCVSEAAKELCITPNAIRLAISSGGRSLGYYWRYDE